MTIQYLNPNDIIDKKQTELPQYRGTRTGYGSKLATSWMLRLKDKQWRRVYVIQYSNAGSAYICTKQGLLFLGSYQP